MSNVNHNADFKEKHTLTHNVEKCMFGKILSSVHRKKIMGHFKSGFAAKNENVWFFLTKNENDCLLLIKMNVSLINKYESDKINFCTTGLKLEFSLNTYCKIV